MSDLEKSTLLTAKQAAERLGVKPSTVSRWMRQGELPYVRLGSANRVTVADLIAFIEVRKERRDPS